MKRLLYLMLGWILFVNIIDAVTTYYAFHNPLPIEEAGLMRTADGRCSDPVIVFHFVFSLAVLILSFWIVKNHYETQRKSLAFHVFFIVMIIWIILDTRVAINNILVIRQALL